MQSKRITLRDVAAALGVSHTTVAMALRNHYSISPKRRDQVRQMAEKMGYCPDPFLSSLAAYRKQISPLKIQSAVAWITHWQQLVDSLKKYEYYIELWRGAFQAAGHLGYHLDDVHWEAGCSAKRFQQILLTRGVRGVLIPPHNMIPDWGDFDWSKFSVVRFGQSVPYPDSNLVTIDHFRAVIMAVRKISEYGYQRIGLVIGDEYNRRLGGHTIGGFCSAQDLLHLKPPLPPLKTEYGSHGNKEMDQQKSNLEKWLKRYRPDAILTTDPEIPGQLHQLGYRIPEDIAVAGTAVRDIPVDAGIDQHAEAVGRIAMETLAKQLNMNECGEPVDPASILIEAHWQDGRSLPPRS